MLLGERLKAAYPSASVPLRGTAKPGQERGRDMPRTNRNLTEKITIQITRPMLADLQNVATKSGKPLAEIVRQAIRNALDDTDLTLGTKRRFDRRLQKRVDEMEQNLERSLEQGLEQAEEKLAESLQEELDKLEYRVNQDFDRNVSKFTKQVTEFMAELTEKKTRRLF
jgi:predicted HicB family RNase H-like nuclease